MRNDYRADFGKKYSKYDSEGEQLGQGTLVFKYIYIIYISIYSSMYICMLHTYEYI